MNIDNSYRFKKINDILYGLDAYYFEKFYHLDGSNLSNNVYKKSFAEYMIDFDLLGGIKEWFENHNCIMSIDKFLNGLNLKFLWADMISCCFYQEYFIKSNYKLKMFNMILKNGIYDNIFKSFDNIDDCMKLINLYEEKELRKTASKNNEIMNKNISITVNNIKKRILKVFKTTL